MRQTAKEPELLFKLIEQLQYKQGWKFTLDDLDRGQGSAGLTLTIAVTGVDSYHPENGPLYTVLHYMIVPPAAYNEQSCCRWLLDQILQVEQHEACEFFKLAGFRPYAPHHGPGHNPYTIFDQGTRVDAETTFRGDKFGKSAGEKSA